MNKNIFFLLSISLLLILVVIPISKLTSTEVDNKEVEKSENEFVKVDIMPELIHSVNPIYPENAKAKGKNCILLVKAFVNIEGKVEKALVDTCSTQGYGFEQSAINAALKAVYKPAIADGKPVSVWVTYKVEFMLDKEAKNDD